MIGTGYWAHHYGFLAPTIFIACCSTAALFATLTLNSQKENFVCQEDTAMTIGKRDAETTESNNSRFKAIFSQLREVFRIYTSNPATCDVCQGEILSHIEYRVNPQRRNPCSIIVEVANVSEKCNCNRLFCNVSALCWISTAKA